MAAAGLGLAQGQRQRQRAEQRQTQRLALTQRMRQSLKLLQLPSYELGQYLMDAALENPAIDLDAVTEADDLSTDEPEARDDSLADYDDWDADGLDYVVTGGSLDEDADPFATASSPRTLRDDLLEQLDFMELIPVEERVCRVLIAALDSRGYLPAELVAPGDGGSAAHRVFEAALRALQSMEPAGVGARSLDECLALQLSRLPVVPAGCETLVRGHLELVAQNNVAGTARLLGCSRDDARRAIECVRSLNPIPARGFDMGESAVPLRPEAEVIEAEDGTVSVVPLGGWSGRLRIDETFREALRATAQGSDAAFAQQSLASASELIESVKARETTVMAVIRSVVRHQPDAVAEGLASLVPLTMGEVAEELDLDVSTISRAVQDKWILTPCGMVALRAFFTGAAYAQADTGVAVAASSVRERISSLVEQEDPAHPLSDQKICDVLAKEGVEVSRRAIAKYRAELGIPSTSVRRKRD